MTLIAAGPSSTMNRVGRMKTIIGIVSRAGRRAAFSSARLEGHAALPQKGQSGRGHVFEKTLGGEYLPRLVEAQS
jgi:hypothetical protein